MPVHEVRKDGKVVGFQYGESGKVYPVGKGGQAAAAKKAGQQAAAIAHSGYKEMAEGGVVGSAMKHPDVLGAGAAKRAHLSPGHKEEAVMKEFERGTLHSGGGSKVHDKAQAEAIAMSEAGKTQK